MWEETETYYWEPSIYILALLGSRGCLIAERSASLDEVHRGLHRVVAPNSQEPLVFMVPVLVLVRGLYLRAIKNYKDSTMSLEGRETR